MPGRDDVEQLRMITKVARLYHTRGMRQTEIAESLGISQARVSRLLSSAEEHDIVRTVVVVPDGLYGELEDQLEKQFGLLEAHVVDAVGSDEATMVSDLGHAVSSVMEVLPLDAKVIGFTSWSRSLREFAASMRPVQKSSATSVVEMLGGVGPPSVQHEATLATETLARNTGSTPMFLRAPGVVASKSVRKAILQQDSHAMAALKELDNMDIALVGIGHCEIVPPLVAGDNFFSEAQFEMSKSLGAVGQVNLRFINEKGEPIESELDELVIGVTLEQLKKTPRRIGVAGGQSKYESIYAALLGGWVNVLVTDVDTARHLLARRGVMID